MPTYLYEHTEDSEECEKEFNIEQSILDDALTVCPDCGLKVKRLIAGGVSAVWKGGAPTSKSYI